jgi:hypothetical protein
MMDAPTDDTIDIPRPRFRGKRLLEHTDESDGALDAMLEVGGKRPIAEAKMAAQPV